MVPIWAGSRADSDQLWRRAFLRPRTRHPHSAFSYHRCVKRHIAIVEDEPALRDNYAAALARHGYLVKTYGNRKLAMQAFSTRLPDLAIIDISLEDEAEGGFDLCRDLRALSAELPIIFLTARDSELDAVSGLRLGRGRFSDQGRQFAAPGGTRGGSFQADRCPASAGQRRRSHTARCAGDRRREDADDVERLAGGVELDGVLDRARPGA